MCEVLAVIHGLMARFLTLSGKAWTRKQEARVANGQTRSWPILEAARGEDVSTCMLHLLLLPLEPIQVARQEFVACCHRKLRFSIASAGACALHSFLRLRRQMLPYQMFMLLADPSARMVDSLLSFPACFRDELSQKLMDRFGSDLSGAEALAILEALASIISVDVASIEAGHSSAREFANLRSRGWTSSLETVSSRFLLLQRKTLGGYASQKRGSNVKPTKKDGKKRRGGGGAWRAFVHHNCKGKKLTAELAASLSAAYHDLSDADWQRYCEAGRAATAVHRMSMRSFPAHPRPSRSSQGGAAAAAMILDGDRRLDGVIIASDAPDGAIQNFAGGGTLTDKYVSFQAELAALFKARVDALDLSEGEVSALARHQETAPCLPAAQQWERDGHSDLAAAVTKLPAAASTTAAFLWNPQIEKPVQAGSCRVLKQKFYFKMF